MSIKEINQPAGQVATTATGRVPPLPDVILEPLVRAALQEDLGRAGDLTTDAIVSPEARTQTRLVAREQGVLAGLDLARIAFKLLDPELRFEAKLQDGDDLVPGAEIAVISGSARAMLTAERCALNFLGHLSGVASATASIARAIAPYGTKVTCTRKTMPGMRALQKYAVRVGGGSNHRFGLDDAVLIKDNHIAVAGGVRAAVQAARAYIGHLVCIEVEVDTLEQLDEVLALGVDSILLDNMDTDTLRLAVARVAGRAKTEASGRITPETAVQIARCGVDRIAVGWITHSARVLDIGLDA
ncbi:MAG TPA: carboxylating nicotinate-nucleotide diphosphorylase [Alcaligenes faecalis]|nr:carboxylating nicotinate-nucleotide diphosphorylase [Alcaligenes faecalis]